MASLSGLPFIVTEPTYSSHPLFFPGRKSHPRFKLSKDKLRTKPKSKPKSKKSPNELSPAVLEPIPSVWAFNNLTQSDSSSTTTTDPTSLPCISPTDHFISPFDKSKFTPTSSIRKPKSNSKPKNHHTRYPSGSSHDSILNNPIPTLTRRRKPTPRSYKPRTTSTFLASSQLFDDINFELTIPDPTSPKPPHHHHTPSSLSSTSSLKSQPLTKEDLDWMSLFQDKPHGDLKDLSSFTSLHNLPPIKQADPFPDLPQRLIIHPPLPLPSFQSCQVQVWENPPTG